MYYKNLNINGTEFKIAVNIAGAGVPTTATEGAVGMLYMNTNNGDLYKCTAASGGRYTWVEALGAGADGFSPTVAVSDITGGHRLTITDASGTKVVDIMDGANGNNGNPGNDGRGIVSVVRTSGNGAAGTTDTYTITYTDSTASTLTVYNGKDGTNGKDGADGAKGNDGYTPVKGVDYYTTADKTELVNMVLAALPAAEGGSF